jgi:hypothetical protein
VRFLAALLLVLSCVTAHADVAVRVAALDPGTEATLGSDEPFYLRLEFNTPQPVRLWARPYFQGAPVTEGARWSGSLERRGESAALSWFSFDGVAEVDEVRIVASPVGGNEEHTVTVQPVTLHWTGGAKSGRTPAAWVDDLLAAEQIEQERQFADHVNKSAEKYDPLFTVALPLCLLVMLMASVGVPLWALRTWRGAWRVAAAVPALVMLATLLRIVVDTTSDPTSHNLWPFEILFSGAFAVVAVSFMAVCRRFTTPARP